MDKFDFCFGWAPLGDGWIMEFKSCHSCEDLAQDRVVKKKIFLSDSAIVWTVPFNNLIACESKSVITLFARE